MRWTRFRAGGEIRLRCRRSPGTVGFAVSDNGCGISPAHLEHVFEPFFTTKEPGKGTGLGLAIARNVVMEHGGTIQIESRPGEGTTAIVDLPLAGVAEAVGEPRNEVRQRIAGPIDPGGG